jgi:hypothetical protein
LDKNLYESRILGQAGHTTVSVSTELSGIARAIVCGYIFYLFICVFACLIRAVLHLILV